MDGNGKNSLWADLQEMLKGELQAEIKNTGQDPEFTQGNREHQ